MTDSIKKNENKIHAAAGDRKIIRRLRIKFCAIMMIIVVAFLAVVFTVQYISNKRTMDEQSENALRMAIDRVDRQNISLIRMEPVFRMEPKSLTE